MYQSVEALAKKLKISKAQYEKYEKGNTDIPISILYEIAHEFKAELTSLLTGEEPKLREYSVVRSGKGPSVDRRKDYKYQDLAYNFQRKKAESTPSNVMNPRRPFQSAGKSKSRR